MECNFSFDLFEVVVSTDSAQAAGGSPRLKVSVTDPTGKSVDATGYYYYAFQKKRFSYPSDFFFANPDIARYDLSSIRRLSGGGAAMPAAVAQLLLDMGVTYYEGYGLSETMGATHLNPPDNPKKQCLGIPIYDVDSRGLVSFLILRASSTSPGARSRPAGNSSRKNRITHVEFVA